MISFNNKKLRLVKRSLFNIVTFNFNAIHPSLFDLHYPLIKRFLRNLTIESFTAFFISFSCSGWGAVRGHLFMPNQPHQLGNCKWPSSGMVKVWFTWIIAHLEERQRWILQQFSRVRSQSAALKTMSSILQDNARVQNAKTTMDTIKKAEMATSPSFPHTLQTWLPVTSISLVHWRSLWGESATRMRKKRKPWKIQWPDFPRNGLKKGLCRSKRDWRGALKLKVSMLKSERLINRNFLLSNDIMWKRDFFLVMQNIQK